MSIDRRASTAGIPTLPLAGGSDAQAAGEGPAYVAPQGRIVEKRIPRQRSIALFLLPVLLLLLGCSRDLPTEFGRTKGRSGMRSINGLGGLRAGFDRDGWRTQEIRRLSPRLQKVDAIVWTPTHIASADAAAADWLHDWLAERPRTLVYVIPDGSSEHDYWRDARSEAPPQQRLEYRRRAAGALTDLMTARGDDLETINRLWFRARRTGFETPRWEIQSLAAAPSATTTTAQGAYIPGDEEVDEQPPLEPSRLRYERIAADDAGRTLVMRITESERRGGRRNVPGRRSLGESQVLVVAGSSLVTNFGLTQDHGQTTAGTLLDHATRVSSGPDQRIGFLLSDFRPVPISKPDEKSSGAHGMELLTVWPISLITMHLAIIGIVICLSLLPIFGRPRRLKQRDMNDFGDHIEAVALMMTRTGGEAFARARISEYFRRVRGETAGRWVLPETLPDRSTAAAKPAPAAGQPVAMPRPPVRETPPAVPQPDNTPKTDESRH